MVAKNLIQRIGQQKAIRLFTEPGGCRRGVFQCSVCSVQWDTNSEVVGRQSSVANTSG